MNKKKNKKAKGVVYSTNPDFQYQFDNSKEDKTLSPNQQDLRVLIDRKQRAGKQVTLVTGFIGADEDLKGLGKILKNKCGVGGTTKNGEIIIQGNFRDRILKILKELGYQAKPSGG